MAATPYFLPTGRFDPYDGHSHSTPTGRVGRYAGRNDSYAGPPLTGIQPAVLKVMPVILTPHQPAVLIVIPDPPHSLPTVRADCYAGPSSLHSNRPR